MCDSDNALYVFELVVHVHQYTCCKYLLCTNIEKMFLKEGSTSQNTFHNGGMKFYRENYGSVWL